MHGLIPTLCPRLFTSYTLGVSDSCIEVSIFRLLFVHVLVIPFALQILFNTCMRKG